MFGSEEQREPLLRDAARNDPINGRQDGQDEDAIVPDVITVYANKAAKLPQILAALIACLAPLSFGTVLGYSSPTLLELKDLGVLQTEETQSWFASVITLGALCGGLIGGFFLEKLGRKGTMMACGLPYTLGWLMILFVASTKSVVLLLAGRALCGVTMGVVCIAAPTYIAEISSAEMRGSLGTLFQVATTTGILMSFVLGIPLRWQWLALACSIVAATMTLCVFFVPETPIYLASKGKEAHALAALRWLRGTNFDYHEEYQNIVDAQSAQPSNGFRITEIFRTRSLWRPILITLGLMVFQQCSGVNNFIFYTKPIFQSAGYEGDPAIPEVIVGAVQVGATLLSVFVMDIAGRKKLLIGSGFFMTIGCIILGLFYYLKEVKGITSVGWMSEMSLILYMVAFSFGWGPIPWTMMAELVPTRIKGFASGLAVCVNWLCAFLVTKEFLAMQNFMTKQGSFWFFGGVNAVGIVFVALCLPETKGKTLGEIQHYFENS